MRRFNLRKCLVVFVAIMMICSVTGCVSSVSMPVLQADGSMLIRGKLRRISVQEGIMKIKPPNGESVVVKLTKETIFKNFSEVADIKKYQPVEVVYVVEGADNLAISVKTIADGSC